MACKKIQRKVLGILIILAVTIILFFTFVVRETMELRHFGSRGIMLIPFREFVGMFFEKNHLFYFLQILLNIILFIPFGFLLTTYLYLHKKQRIHTIWRPILISGFLFSLSIEIFQFITGRGYTEVDDIINNTLGAMVGYWIYRALLNRIKKSETDI